MSDNPYSSPGGATAAAGGEIYNGLQTRHGNGRTPALLGLLCLMLCLTLPAGADGDDSRRLEHVVIAWLKEPGNSAAQNRIIAASQVLKTIPGVMSLRAGTAIASERPIVDSSFDVALVIQFADRAALDHYLTHPLHVQLVEVTLKPLVERILVYDFTSK